MLWSSFAPRNPTQDGGDLTGLGLEDVEIIAEQLDGDVAAHAADEHQHVTTAIHQFLRMYRPHASREDTILFPAFRELVSGHEYEALGEKFENREHELFGKEGLEGVLVEVAKLEAAVGISDLSIFTPAG